MEKKSLLSRLVKFFRSLFIAGFFFPFFVKESVVNGYVI